MKSGYIHPNFVAPDKPNDVVYISYSQFQGYMKCPKYWKLCYIDKLKQKTPTIHTVFGNAMHTVIQEWVEILYNGKVKDAEAFDFDTRLHVVGVEPRAEVGVPLIRLDRADHLRDTSPVCGVGDNGLDFGVLPTCNHALLVTSELSTDEVDAAIDDAAYALGR